MPDGENLMISRQRVQKSLALGVLLIASWAAASPADPRDTNSPYGMLEFLPWDQEWSHFHYTEERVEKAAALMEEAGVRIVRIDFAWEDIEPRQGEFSFAKHERILDALDRHHLKTLAILHYNPAWRSSAPWNSAPIQEDYLTYARATIHHFKTRVKYWEIWNEPDSKTYWIPQDGMVAYSRLLKAVYPVIKAEDPSAQVLLGGMTENGPFSLRRVYQNAGKDCFDIVNIHPFADPIRPHSNQTLKGIYISLMRVMKEFGDEDKPIWFTELGCPGVKKPGTNNGWWEGMSPTEEQQAQWVTTVYTEALQWKGVKKIFWAFFRETPDIFHCGVDNFGLVRDDFSKKLAYEAYKRAAHPHMAASQHLNQTASAHN